MGYHRAGFKVVGVDIEPQPNYPFEFYQGDAIEFIRNNGGDFDVIHASPPCQKYSVAAHIHKNYEKHPDLLPETREALDNTGKPWIIENVPFSPMRPDLKLFGYMFGLKVIRQRWFEFGNGLFLMQPGIPQQIGTVKEGDFACVFGNGSYRKSKGDAPPKFRKSSVKKTWAFAMGIDWMNVAEMAEAIPPAYTEYIGKEILRILTKSY